MNRDIRAALIGGLAATFVVAASLAPKLAGHSDEVKVRNSATETSAAPPADDVAGDEATATTGATGDLAPPALPTTAPKRSATPKPSSGGTSSTSGPIGASTTMPGAVPTAPSTVLTTTTLPAAPKIPTVRVVREVFEGAWRRVYFTTDVAAPNLKVHFLFRVKSGAVEQFTAVFGQPRVLPEYESSTAHDPMSALYEFTTAEVGNSDINRYADYYQGMVGWEWDGGSRQAPAAPPAPALKVSASQVDRCASGSNCTALRFTSDRPADQLFVVYRIRMDSGEVDRWLTFGTGKSDATEYYGPGSLLAQPGDGIPGFVRVVHVGWLGGATDGSTAQICSPAQPC